MKKVALLFMSVAMIALASCSKEGEQGPAGPSGPAGPAGQSAVFEINEITVAAADFAGGTYNEYQVDFITQDIYDNGVAVAYVQDGFGYWNTIPSQWHEITDFGFFNTTDPDTNENIGIVGFSADGGITSDYQVRVVTMKRAEYDALNAEGLLADYNAVMNFLGAKK